MKNNQFYLKDEFTNNSVVGDGSEPRNILAFKWTKIGTDKYAVVMPKIFRKAKGDVLVIINTKRMMKLLDTQQKL